MVRGMRPGDLERGARRPQVAVASPHPLPACRASLCRSAASGHSARARAPLAPPPFSARFPPPRPPRVGWGYFFYFFKFFCSETLGGSPPVRWWPRPAPRVPREGAGPPSSRLRGRPAGAGTPGTGPCPRGWEEWPTASRIRPVAFPT